ncbi:MAG: gliding motility-associated ABC transporter ATP-binding subunit GldA [Bacteroidetes bacterium]|nr:MAG: gliding motility-associated ABC transporter ATP-binding subunit GldA [Bacteroidota bacterium]
MKICVRDLTKIYGEQRAIDKLNFEVEQGEILGFLGPNGAGKTTSMKIITCFIPPTSGTVEVGEYNIFEHPLEIRQRIGYLPEHNPLYLDMYVHEFLDFIGRVYQLEKKHRKKRIAEVIEMTGLGREQHKKIGMLSKGYRQRVGLSQALLHDPPVLILDEPTTGLDPNQIVEIRQMIKTVGQDKTVIFSSHILSEVEAIAERVVIINRGKIVADAPIQQIHQMARDERVVRLELEQPGFDFEAIQKLEGIRQIVELSPTTFEIHTRADVDVRKALFEACVQQQNALMGLSMETFTLEDAFRKLTA